MAKKAKTRPQQHTSLWDYWLHRYQALIVGLVAVIAAIWAAMVASEQLIEMRRQSAVALRPVIDQRLAELDEEFLLVDILNIVTFNRTETDPSDIEGKTFEEWADEMIMALEDAAQRKAGSANLRKARSILAEYLRDWRNAYMDFNYAKKSALDEGRGEIDEVNTLRAKMRERGLMAEGAMALWAETIRSDKAGLHRRIAVIDELAVE